MKGQRLLIAVALLALLMASVAGSTLAQGPEPPGGDISQTVLGTSFTYQGRLQNASGPVTSNCDFQFSLWDSLSNSTGQIGTTQTKTNVPVSAGLFTVTLDFGADAFTGDARWLRIAVRCPAGSGSYATLSPRQPLTAAPYALSLKPGATIHNKATSGTTVGLTIESDAGHGLYVKDATLHGIQIDAAGMNGINVLSAGSHGLYVADANLQGVQIDHADFDGVEVYSATVHGLHVVSAGDDGVYVERAGTPSSTTPSADKNGFEVAGAEGDGLWVGRANLNGVIVYSAGNRGVEVVSTGNDGVYVGRAGSPS
ncbi:MAG: hypothetical protein KJ734_09175, partial [Chloroflexi bacterium]|nr:hypothetical protein [Chloroflexota bacterium]